MGVLAEYRLVITELDKGIIVNFVYVALAAKIPLAASIVPKEVGKMLQLTGRSISHRLPIRH